MNLIATIEEEIARLMSAEGEDAINIEVSRAKAIEGMASTINEVNRTHMNAAKLAYDMGYGNEAGRMLLGGGSNGSAKGN